MSTATEKLDGIMERASQALADLDYLVCEALCLEALAEARDQRRFGFYARVLLPLQEARRQRRMIAAQGKVDLGTTKTKVDTEHWLSDRQAGCLVLTQPNTLEDARELTERAQRENKYVEVLFADNVPTASRWTLRSYKGPAVSCEIDAPPPGQTPGQTPGQSPGQSPNLDHAQWFLYATERLGDAALASADETLTGESLIRDLEALLSVFPDHELLHQRLAQAARTVGTNG